MLRRSGRGLLLSQGRKEQILGPTHDHAGLGCGHRDEVGYVQPIPDPGEQAEGTDRAGEIVGLLCVSRRHPADGNDRLHAGLERGDHVRPPSTPGEAGASDPGSVDLLAGQQIVDATAVVTEVDAGPGGARPIQLADAR